MREEFKLSDWPLKRDHIQLTSKLSLSINQQGMRFRGFKATECRFNDITECVIEAYPVNKVA
jgi:hypothetical protein